MDNITLIIPCHNLEKWITPCLNSLKKQENKQKLKRRVIFICDNCTDKTHSIIEDKMKYCYSWKWEIIDAAAGSPGAARNIGLDKTNSEYVWFVDGDDWLTCNNAIDELYRLMKKDDMDIIEFKIKSKANPDGAFGGGTVWRCVLSSRIIGNMRFNDRQIGEDNDFIWDIYHKPGAKYGKIALAPYFYNFPRIGSQMWKKANNKED
jgi:glycosyltransferase involved in cell wall biosynthesis